MLKPLHHNSFDSISIFVLDSEDIVYEVISLGCNVDGVAENSKLGAVYIKSQEINLDRIIKNVRLNKYLFGYLINDNSDMKINCCSDNGFLYIVIYECNVFDLYFYLVNINSNAADVLKNQLVIKVSEIINSRADQVKCLSDNIRGNKENVMDFKQFGYLISHNAKVPIISINGFTSELSVSVMKLKEILKRRSCHINYSIDTELTDTLDNIDEYLMFFRKSVNDIEKVIKYIDNMIEILELNPSISKVDLDDLLNMILKVNFRNEDVRIYVEKLGEIYTDLSIITRIILILLDNSIKYKDINKDERIITISSEIINHK